MPDEEPGKAKSAGGLKRFFAKFRAKKGGAEYADGGDEPGEEDFEEEDFEEYRGEEEPMNEEPGEDIDDGDDEL